MELIGIYIYARRIIFVKLIFFQRIIPSHNDTGDLFLKESEWGKRDFRFVNSVTDSCLVFHEN